MSSTDTSAAAYAAIRPHITAQAKRILDYLSTAQSGGVSGFTSYQLGVYLAMKPQSVSARVNELHEKGWIEDTGLRRPTDTGRKAIVWRVRA